MKETKGFILILKDHVNKIKWGPKERCFWFCIKFLLAVSRSANVIVHCLKTLLSYKHLLQQMVSLCIIAIVIKHTFCIIIAPELRIQDPGVGCKKNINVYNRSSHQTEFLLINLFWGPSFLSMFPFILFLVALVRGSMEDPCCKVKTVGGQEYRSVRVCPTVAARFCTTLECRANTMLDYVYKILKIEEIWNNPHIRLVIFKLFCFLKIKLWIYCETI